nr:MAG TPA: hypothetical protein [Caudoviricetes sp.]
MKSRSKTDSPDALFRGSRRGVGELSQAIQDAYTGAHSSGRLSELDEIMREACVPIPTEIVTRSRMIQVWEEGCEKFPDGRAGGLHATGGMSIAEMLHYSSTLMASSLVPKGTVREWLWKIANSAAHLLDEDFDVLSQALEEYSRAAKKHPDMTLECDGHTDDTRLFALVEEIGEVAACLTYDNNSETGHGSDLEAEVIQVIALALAWATRYLEEDADE